MASSCCNQISPSERASDTQDVANDGACGDGDARAWASDDEWVSSVAFGAQHEDILWSLSPRQWLIWADLAQVGDHCPLRIHGADVAQRLARCARRGDTVTQVIAPGGQRRQKVVTSQRLSTSRYQAFDRNIRYLGRISCKAC